MLLLWVLLTISCLESGPDAQLSQSLSDSHSSAIEAVAVVNDYSVESILGGAPGHNGTAVARDADGYRLVAAVDARTLTLYRQTAGGIVEEPLADNASTPRLVVDDAGREHVAYHDLKEQTLVYGYDDGGWQWTTVDDELDEGGSLDLTVDADGHAHLSYYKGAANNGMMCYATNATGAWIAETIADDIDFSDGQTSVALDASGGVRLSYLQDEQIHYASQTADGWSSEVVADADNSGGRNALAIDADGHAHIAFSKAYCYWTNDYFWQCMINEVDYATNASGSWLVETVEESSDGEYSGCDVDLALDAAGAPHIVFAQSYPRLLFYAVPDGEGWMIETVEEATTSYKVHPALLVNDTGEALVSYYREVTGELALAERDGGAWTPVTLAGDGLIGNASLVQGPDGSLHVVATKSNRLHYLVNGGKGWKVEQIPLDGHFSSTPALAVDANGHAHLVAFDGKMGELLYITNKTGQWRAESVVADCSYADVVIDNLGRVLIAYIDDDREKLMLARWFEGSWLARPFDGATWGNVRLEFDAEGHLHLLYSYGLSTVYLTDKTGAWERRYYYGDDKLTIWSISPGDLAVDGEGYAHLSVQGSGGNQYGQVHSQMGYRTTRPGIDSLDLGFCEGYGATAAMIALDARNRPHIVYSGISSHSLIYVYWTGSEFASSSLEDTGEAFYPQGLVQTSDGALHLLYLKERTLYHASFSPATGSIPER